MQCCWSRNARAGHIMRRRPDSAAAGVACEATREKGKLLKATRPVNRIKGSLCMKSSAFPATTVIGINSAHLRPTNRRIVSLSFQALMKFPPDYPYSPPSIRFLTKVWHPNVYEVIDSPARCAVTVTLIVAAARALRLCTPRGHCRPRARRTGRGDNGALASAGTAACLPLCDPRGQNWGETMTEKIDFRQDRKTAKKGALEPPILHNAPRSAAPSRCMNAERTTTSDGSCSRGRFGGIKLIALSWERSVGQVLNSDRHTDSSITLHCK